MSLIKSISGVRGTIGGKVGDALTPIDVVALTTAFGRWLLKQPGNKTVVIGRDARPSGSIISRLVSSTLQSLGMDVIDLGLSTTPTVSIAVPQEQACGGIVITASHNSSEWNALKMLNGDGELIDAVAAAEVFAGATQQDHSFVPVEQLGQHTTQEGYIAKHIAQIMALPLVDVPAIRRRKFRIAVDAVNSTGGIAVPQLLQGLGVAHITALYCQPNGQFPHNPEPLPAHLTALAHTVRSGAHDLGVAVDPDVDRLVVIDENGMPWGEEYTLVAAADYVLRHTPGNTVSNLSSSQALKEITEQYGGHHASTPVGEQYVVAKMKATQAVIGGEGNGGVIYPALHYGRDALAGIALLLSHLAHTEQTASTLRATYPNYVLVKHKIQLIPDTDLATLLGTIRQQYSAYPMNTEDGVKILFEKAWIHLRQSNTEPIIRLYAEAETEEQANHLVKQLRQQISSHCVSYL
ncbi:MAG TPA: phosphoglucosamine mutase [Amoebophilaceae bacterium]|nr:phosphoglucosamine mutase [Amoebophilaceae bacterium]